VGVVSALVDGARVDTEAVDSEGDRAARRETSVPVAKGGVDCHVRCHCRHCQLCQGDASVGTGTSFRTPGRNPCVRAARDASACGKGDELWHKNGKKEKGPHRSEDATEGKTETVYVGIAVGVVIHRG